MNIVDKRYVDAALSRGPRLRKHLMDVFTKAYGEKAEQLLSEAIARRQRNMDSPRITRAQARVLDRRRIAYDPSWVH